MNGVDLAAEEIQQEIQCTGLWKSLEGGFLEAGEGV